MLRNRIKKAINIQKTAKANCAVRKLVFKHTKHFFTNEKANLQNKKVFI